MWNVVRQGLWQGLWRGARQGVQLGAVAATSIWLTACASQPESDQATIQLEQVSFTALPDWAQQDVPQAALDAFRTTCLKIEKRPDSRSMGGSGYAGTVGDWRAVCDGAATVSLAAAKTWFEDNFTPFHVSDRGTAEGLYTGYYEPSLLVSREQSTEYQVPLYAKPETLVMVDLGAFRDDLKGRRIAGTVENGRLVPFADRSEIDGGALDGEVTPIAYAKDAVDVFFLHIQGSGKGFLPDGSFMRIGYAGQNGHPYFAIGRELIERGALTKENVSLQTIRQWLHDHPDEAESVLHMNPSYVFFREIEGAGPIGAAGVALTPGASLAVDRKFHAMGVPMWVSTTEPLASGDVTDLNRLMIAQDTGGAIRGPVRGDVFWGAGQEAEFTAGHMKQPGYLFVLLPKTLIQ